MNKSMLIGTVLGAIGVTATGTMAGYKLLDKGPQFADVLNVQEVTETVRTPREVCHNEVVTHQRPSKDPNNVAGTVVGAVVGGLLGNQVGDGSGKKIATLAGAAAGGLAGNKVQEQMQSNNTYTTTEKRCKTVTDTTQQVVGYDVQYRLEGKVGTVRMDQRPGDTIPLENGELVLTQAPLERTTN